MPGIIQHNAYGESQIHGPLAKLTDAEVHDAGYTPFPFRRFLPIAQLLLCALLLFPYRADLMWTLFGIHMNVPANRAVASALTSNPDGTINFSPNPEFERWFKAKDNAYDTVSFLNLPGLLPQVPFIILRERHDELRPGTIEPRTWHVITWPILALPFWWMSGRGLEALIAASRGLIFSRIGWISTVISYFLMAGGLCMAIGFLLFAGTDRADPVLQLMACASLMWGVLSSLTVAARVAQWRLRKRGTS